MTRSLAHAHPDKTTVKESGHKLLQVICVAKRVSRRRPPQDGTCALVGQCIPLIDAFLAATQPDDAANIDLSSKRALKFVTSKKKSAISIGQASRAAQAYKQQQVRSGSDLCSSSTKSCCTPRIRHIACLDLLTSLRAYSQTVSRCSTYSCRRTHQALKFHHRHHEQDEPQAR